MSVLTPMVAVVGPTASGKSALALQLAEVFGGEIVSCDSVAVYRGLNIGSSKPSLRDRARVPHHGLDLLDPDEPSTAGDYARVARVALGSIRERGRLPILSGGTGLYLRAVLDGLAPAPRRDEDLRTRLRAHALRRGSGSLHQVLRRFDPKAAGAIHPNDLPKVIRSLEVSMLARRPQTEQWQRGREPLQGFRVLQLGLQPPRTALYERINRRAAEMFTLGLVEETAAVWAKFGERAGALGALGYAQALRAVHGQIGLTEAIVEAQQGHRNYAKRQMTWFRRDARICWLAGFGDDPMVQAEAVSLVQKHLTLEQAGEGA